MKKSLFLALLVLISTSHVFSTEGQNKPLGLNDYLDSIRVYFYKDYQKSYSFALEGLEKADPAQHTLERIRLLQVTAEIEYFYLNDFYSSLIRLNEMRFLSDSIRYERGIPWFKLNLANVYLYLDALDKALELYEEAMAGGGAFGDSIIYFNALCGKSDILRQREEFSQAFALLDEGLAFALRENRPEMQLFLYDDLADINKRLGQFQKSYSLYERTLEIAVQEESAYWIIVSEVNLEYVKYLMRPGYDPVAKLKELKERAFSRGFYRQYIQISNTLVEIFENRGYYRQALLENKSVESLKDSIYGMEGIRKVAELESLYHIEKTNLENLNLIRKNEINALKLQSRKIILLIIGVSLFLTLSLLLIIARKYHEVRNNVKTIKEQEQKIYLQANKIIQKEKEMVEQRLIVQERELAGKLMQIFHHNQLLQKLSDDVAGVKEYCNRGSHPDLEVAREKLQSIENEVSVSLPEKWWDEFEKYFVEINPDFIRKLHSKHPNLTTNETKLCIFLFLNLRSKEISAITQQSVKSINVARTRLRKKLGLVNTDTNLTSYMKQV